MRKYWLVFLLLMVGLIGAPAKANASVQDFTIPSFTADYYLTRDPQKVSSLDVKEEIVAEFPDFDQNHGILRSIPKTYQDHTVSLVVKSVTNDTGQSLPYSTYTENDNEVLRIGNANTYVHGLNTYVISYSMHNVISFPDDRPNTNEFYWDVNGDQWAQTMDKVIGRLHIPKDLATDLTGQKVCYSGYYGSQDTSSCSITTDEANDSTVITTSASQLTERQNLSVVVGFKDNSFIMGPEIAAEQRRQILLAIALVGGTLVLPIITFVVCYRKWRAKGRDPKGRGVIIPEYVAPKGLNVMSSSFILNQSLQPKAVSAGIIELAIQGYLLINVTEKKKLIGKSSEYELEIVKDPAGLAQEQQLILNALFDDGTVVGSKVSIASQKNKLYSTVSKISKHLATTLTTLGYFSSDPTKAKKRFTTAAVIMFAFGWAFIAAIPLGVGLLLSAFIVFVFSIIMPARTPKGVETYEYIKGLKEYIKMAEADRLKYLQSPQGAERKKIDAKDQKQMLHLFEDLLPYAILFGLEKDWAKQFEGLYDQPPGWYNGNMSTFNAIYLASSLNGFSSANSAAFTSPSSSSSSGFGGGGFSGGGGGGGGGGGW